MMPWCQEQETPFETISLILCTDLSLKSIFFLNIPHFIVCCIIFQDFTSKCTLERDTQYNRGIWQLSMSPHCVTIWIHIQLSIAIHFNPSVASDCRFRWARRAKTTPVHMLHVFISTSINRVNIQDKLFEMIFWKALFHLHLLIYPPPAPQLALKKPN